MAERPEGTNHWPGKNDGGPCILYMPQPEARARIDRMHFAAQHAIEQASVIAQQYARLADTLMETLCMLQMAASEAYASMEPTMSKARLADAIKRSQDVIERGRHKPVLDW